MQLDKGTIFAFVLGALFSLNLLFLYIIDGKNNIVQQSIPNVVVQVLQEIAKQQQQ